MHISLFQYSASMIGYCALLVLTIDIMRKQYRFAAIFWVLSLLTIPLWFSNISGWFRWAKTFSVLLPTIIVGFARVANREKLDGFWKAFRKEWVYWFFYGILFLNIAEATIKDFTQANYFNALAGFILCFTIPFPKRFWKISESGYGDLIAYTTIGWNFLYTTWNACFVYGESPAYFSASLCILLAAEVYPLLKKKPEIYITARIYTLALHILLRASFDIFKPMMDSSSWFNPGVLRWWGILNAVLLIGYLFWYQWQFHTGRADRTFRNALPIGKGGTR